MRVKFAQFNLVEIFLRNLNNHQINFQFSIQKNPHRKNLSAIKNSKIQSSIMLLKLFSSVILPHIFFVSYFSFSPLIRFQYTDKVCFCYGEERNIRIQLINDNELFAKKSCKFGILSTCKMKITST